MHIQCLLGQVSCVAKRTTREGTELDEEVVVDISKAKANSTRWIFDITQGQTGPSGLLNSVKLFTYRLTLLDFKTRKAKITEAPNPHFTPLNEAAAHAAILAHPDLLQIQVVPAPPGSDLLERAISETRTDLTTLTRPQLSEVKSPDIAFRVTVDVYHSLHR